MNKKGYSQILDAAAGDQVPRDMNLAPNIITRIAKRKRNHMRTRTMLFSSALLAVIVLVILISTVPGVAAAVGRWFGFVPGVGLVREGTIRVLAEPVAVTREGVTVTVDQVVINQERTTLLYSVDGIPAAAQDTPADEPLCQYHVELRLPDGSPLLATPNGVRGWDDGYQQRFDYAPLPAAVNEATFVISCLFNTRRDLAPADWELPLRFIPAPPQMTVFPVIEITQEPISTQPAAATSQPAEAAPTLANALGIATEAAPAVPTSAPAPMTLAFERAVPMDGGYLLYARLNWADTPFNSVDITGADQTLRLLDGSGQEVPCESYSDEQTGVNWDLRQTVFAVKTGPLQSPGELTLVLESVTVILPADASFVFDPGADPQPGQVWQPGPEIVVGERRLRVRNITAEEGGYSFEMSSTDGIRGASLFDPDHPIANGYEGESGKEGAAYLFFSGFYYADGLPAGPVTIQVGSIGLNHIQRLEARWTPPAQ